MQNSEANEPSVLGDDQIVPERKAKSKQRSQHAKAKLTPTNHREMLWNSDDPLLGLHEEVIETHAHAYMFNAQIRSVGTFEAFLRARLLGESHGLNESAAKRQANYKAVKRKSMKPPWSAHIIVERLTSSFAYGRNAWNTASAIVRRESRSQALRGEDG